MPIFCQEGILFPVLIIPPASLAISFRVAAAAVSCPAHPVRTGEFKKIPSRSILFKFPAQFGPFIRPSFAQIIKGIARVAVHKITLLD
mgnify:FL=1